MVTSFLAAVIAVSFAPADTTVKLGTVERDLTADNVPEVLSLTGTGETLDRLTVTLLIQSSGRTIYSESFVLRKVDFNGPRILTEAEFRTRLGEYGRDVLATAKFRSPEGLVAMLRASMPEDVGLIPEVISRGLTPIDLQRARVIWEEMRTAGITTFEFSAGGDAVTAIGWSATDDRFYHLWECC